MNILNEIYKKWKNAETDKEGIAYMECYFLVQDYLQDCQYSMTQEMKKYHNARILADKVIELVREYDGNK